ncbi:MAG TPA: transposase domain-containing protein, partial [Gemmataceae bacterium]|nr:transposase domain-containing protein [Gemmataceae bacterium]
MPAVGVRPSLRLRPGRPYRADRERRSPDAHFTSTCRRLGVEPWAYLKDVLTRLPTTSQEKLPNLL